MDFKYIWFQAISQELFIKDIGGKEGVVRVKKMDGLLRLRTIQLNRYDFAIDFS